MGPCFRGMENYLVICSPRGSQELLQWGHALGAWKTDQEPMCPHRPPQASMGPCFRGMENFGPNSGRFLLFLASMGPCFRGMENPTGPVYFYNFSNASMGPCFRGMENYQFSSAHDTVYALQWGHALGAWKTWGTRLPASPNALLQWGHALGAWKTAYRDSSDEAACDASMGPCFRGMEN